MSKYIEELFPGDCFTLNSEMYIATIDFKKTARMCINLKTGQPSWIMFDKSVENISIYTIDENNNFAPINPEPANATIKNQNIS